MRHLRTAPIVLRAVLGVLAASASAAALVLNKCCPQGDLLVLDESGVALCRDNDASRAGAQDVRPQPLPPVDGHTSASGRPQLWLDWKRSVFNAGDLQQSNLSLADWLPKTTRVRYGVRPCTSFHQQAVYAHHGWDDRYRFFTNGTLFLDLSSFYGNGEVSLNPDEYCIDVLHETNIFMSVILSCPCERVPCFWKCLAADTEYVFNEDDKLFPNETEAGEMEKTWRPFRGHGKVPVHHLIDNRLLQCNLSDSSLITVILNEFRGQRRGVTALANGSALLGDIEGAVAPGLWCGESIRLESGERVATAHLCRRPTRDSTPRLLAYASFLAVSAFFLLLTLAVYAALPELRAQPHAKALMCHCAALVLGCAVLAAAQAGWYPKGPACEFIALAIQFSYLAAFFWLSILAYDISQAFREYSKPCHSQSTSQRTFRRYAFIAWGIPFLVTCTTFIIVRFQRADQLPNGIVPPNIGNLDCWFGDSAAKWMYFNGVFVVLMVINTVLYIMTTARLCGFIRNTKELTRGESCMHGTSSRLANDKLRFWLHSRLFLVMGLLWGFDAIAPALEGTPLEDDSDHFYWFAVDVLNLLRGFVLFCIYCCKRKVVHKLRERAASWGLEWAAPPAAGAGAGDGDGDGDAHGPRWPRRWSAWLSSAGAASAAAPSEPRRRPSTLSLFRPRAASSAGPAHRARLSTQSTCVSSRSRSPTAHAHSTSPAITPIPEKCEDPFAERASCGQDADIHLVELETEGHEGERREDDESRRWSFWSRLRLSSNAVQSK